MPRGNPRPGPAPNGEVPATTRASIEMARRMLFWPEVDLADPQAVMGRYERYLDLCDELGSKVLVSGLCAAFGITRGELMEWSKGARTGFSERLSPESSRVFKKIIDFLEVSWEAAMANDGYRNPVTGIFLGKNNFGYRDESQTVVRHEDSRSGPSVRELQARYGDVAAASLPDPPSVPAEDVTIEPPEGGGQA